MPFPPSNPVDPPHFLRKCMLSKMHLFHQVCVQINERTKGGIDQKTKIVRMGEIDKIPPQLWEVTQIMPFNLRILTHLRIKEKIHNLGLATLVPSMVSMRTIYIIVPYSLELESYGSKSPKVLQI